MRVRTLLVVLLLGFVPSTVHADLYCTYTVLGWVDTGFFYVPVLNYVCYDIVTVSPSPYPVGGGPGDPSPYPVPPPLPPPAPLVTIDYVSDANPGDVQVIVRYDSGDMMRIYRNGSMINTITPSTTVHLGSLNSCCGIANPTDYRIDVCNTSGCGSDVVGVVRTRSDAYTRGQVYAVYWDLVPDGKGGLEIKRGDVVWQRVLALDVVYTGYTVGTREARNGRVMHRSVSDELFWSDATSRMPLWDATYFMTPSYLPQPQAYPESSGIGGCAGYLPVPYSDTKCANVSEFAIADLPSGVAVIGSIKGTGSAFVPFSPAIGDLTLTVIP